MKNCTSKVTSILFSSLNTGLPPVLQSPDDHVKELFSSIEKLPIHKLQTSKCIIPKVTNHEECFTASMTSPHSFIKVGHDPVSGELLGFVEEEIEDDAGRSAKNSISMKRRPCFLSEGIRGNTTNCPFLPGGFDVPDLNQLISTVTLKEIIDFKGDLLNTPPGFKEGVAFENTNIDWLLADQSKSSLVSVADLLSDGFELLNKELINREIEEHKQLQNAKENSTVMDAVSKITEVVKLEHRQEPRHDDFINNAASLGSSYRDNDENGSSQFVCVVDIQQPVRNFKKLVPDPALKFDFELDTFQKQAIIHMEKKYNVFVAAHTSAGKTVVAEYAIALSLNHMTKAIYTSPIKALSNQKFRDFKHKFKDVGLVTGDVQIRPESNVLVMTTEILRSMLYNGSDVIRDLEWVIFDEVHYINDSERGVVWEEVLILLPAHVKIVMLSATVPNTREFAEWVGRIKKKKVYVISTPKRPVPLEHYLYTGNNSKTSNELFLILDANKNFLADGHRKAVEAKKSRASKVDQMYGSKRPRYNVNPKQEQQIWSSLILQLDKKDKLPAVAFVFSKRRIDDNASNLKNLDLLTSSQKSQVVVFFEKSIKVLKAPDRELPQVKTLKEILLKGIGVHHSGILPILKEIVEMLFQRGLVKVLFATETFAMGVNMPARTVIFDSIQKHDREGLRDLLPGEYIQMAGRAGRRGLDDTGTVIILCKSDVPENSDLHGMMMGMPMVLKSQFRITYSMVLNLLRVEQLRIEDMMRRSFVEFNTERDSDKKLARLKELTEKLEKEEEQSKGVGFSSMSSHLADLPDYYKACEEYYILKDRIMDIILKNHQTGKAMSPGRVVVLEKVGGAQNVPGVVLGTVSGRDKIFKIFINADDVIKTMHDKKCNDVSNDDIKPKPYMGVNLYKVMGSTTPKMVEAQFKDFTLISSKVLKVNADKIIDDFKKREMLRFRDDPPSQSTMATSHDLLRLLDSYTDLPELDPVNDLHIQEMDTVDARLRMNFLESNVKETYNCLGDPLFEERFKMHRRKKLMEKEINAIKYELSDQSLIFLPEYQNRIKVLLELGHISKTNEVKMKGRVACELSNQELLITEMILENLITDLDPEVIAAILSCVVFEQKRCSEPKLNTKLKEVYGKFKVMADNLTAVQKHFRVMEDEVIEQCNNGLMEVVYEWAKGVPFAKLTELTDVQEGVIVRCIQRLNELFRDIGKAAKIIGDPVLGKKMEEASKLVKRDIVFTGSLYLQ